MYFVSALTGKQTKNNCQYKESSNHISTGIEEKENFETFKSWGGNQTSEQKRQQEVYHLSV